VLRHWTSSCGSRESRREPRRLQARVAPGPHLYPRRGQPTEAAFRFHELAPLFETRSVPDAIPVAARDVPVGTCWAFRDHRTMAEVMRDENRVLLLSPPIGPVGKLP
jgi:hypothetical protein